MKKLFLFLLLSIMFFSGSLTYADGFFGFFFRNSSHDRDSYPHHGARYRYCPECNRYHDYDSPHFRHEERTGDVYNPNDAYYGAHEEGAGEHVPTGSVASPDEHGVHHGYHYSQEEGWHSGSHYGHE